MGAELGSRRYRWVSRRLAGKYIGWLMRTYITEQRSVDKVISQRKAGEIGWFESMRRNRKAAEWAVIFTRKYC